MVTDYIPVKGTISGNINFYSDTNPVAFTFNDNFDFDADALGWLFDVTPTWEFNDNSILSGSLEGNPVFNDLSICTGSVLGDAHFTNDAIENYIPMSGLASNVIFDAASLTFSYDGTFNFNVDATDYTYVDTSVDWQFAERAVLSGQIIADTFTFADHSYLASTATIQAQTGDSTGIFTEKGTGRTDSLIAGNITVNFPSHKPYKGTVTGDITYVGYPTPIPVPPGSIIIGTGIFI